MLTDNGIQFTNHAPPPQIRLHHIFDRVYDENGIEHRLTGRRLKTLRGLTPYEYICKIWTAKPQRFTLEPHHHTPGLST